MTRTLVRTHKVTIRRLSGAGTLQRGGGRVADYSVVATDVDCNIQPRSGDIRETAFGKQPQSMHRIFMPHDQDIESDDEIEVTSGAYAETFLRAVFVGTQGDPWDTQIDCARSDTDAKALVP